ncbi:DapH/DapD/GlmU-related protein [Streptomyces sp. NPDC048417]|uniref:acyltransferase n=1 Tax=Streptomyces sp. NPDC048417 TaxID=3155387 RepID=UPI0034221823
MSQDGGTPPVPAPEPTAQEPSDTPTQDDGLFEHCPWLFSEGASDAQRAEQRLWQQKLLATGTVTVGERCYVAKSAAVYPDRLHLGDDSYIGAHAYVTGDITVGADCSLNPFTTVRGTVKLGDGVRIGAHTSVLGFNHTAEPDIPVHQQPVTSRGISIGDDVWIGSHVVVLDGVTIGDHCVIGAGAVVTKSVPAWTVAAGNPARPIRDRRTTIRPAAAIAPHGRLAEQLAEFRRTATDHAADLIARCWAPDAPGGGRYVDRPGAAPTVRAHCDAVEIADLLLGNVPEQGTAASHIERLRAAQDPHTGLVPETDLATGLPRPLPPPAADGFVDDGAAQYHVLSVGYALDLLGSSFAHPIGMARTMTAGRLVRRLDALPWHDRAWHAGSWIDSWATAAHWNLRRDDEPPASGALEALFGWLLTRVDPSTGLWGAASPATGRLQQVNGYYRLTRGTFAQFGLPVPHPERVIDAVLDHSRDPRHFTPSRENACNVLDVAHPLWLCARQTSHRNAEIRHWAAGQLAEALPRWHPGQGFGFGPPADGGGPGREPGLQGTEMWLAIVWTLADLTGLSDLLGYRPRGVHRPEPAGALAAGDRRT